MQRSGAAEGDERELAGVEAALHGDDAQRALHVRDGDVEDGLRGAPLVAREGLGEAAGGAERAVEVERHRAAEQAGGREPAEQQVGVGDGEGVAAPVGGGAGVGAGGLRADVERAAGVEASDRAAAGADRVDVDGGRARRQAVDVDVGPRGERAVAERDVGRGAAHVEADHALEAGAAGGVEGAGHAGGGPRQQRGHGQRGGALGGGRATVGLHDAQRARTALGEAGLEACEVG